MKRLSFFLLAAILISGCSQPEITPEQKSNEIEAIKNQISKLFKAYEDKDLEAVKSIMSSTGDIILFGTDSAEINIGISDCEKQLKNDWQLWTVKAGELKNLYIQISKYGDFASAIHEIPLDFVSTDGGAFHTLFRMASTFRKENGEWRMIMGLTAVATIGQSSAELIEKKKISKK